MLANEKINGHLPRELDVVTFITEGYHDFILDVFFKTLPPEITSLTILNYKDISLKESKLSGETGNPLFKELMYHRSILYGKYMKEHPNRHILFMDNDIIFYRNFKQDMIDIMERCDITTQVQNQCGAASYKNTGVLGMNSTPKVIDFWHNNFLRRVGNLPAEDRPKTSPQTEFNEYIIEDDLDLVYYGLPFEWGGIATGYNTYFYHAIGNWPGPATHAQKKKEALLASFAGRRDKDLENQKLSDTLGSEYQSYFTDIVPQKQIQ
tara:strand:- start:10039 stop:10833 length:795 start_codon:yes stop_codon:yes gene_type:complete